QNLDFRARKIHHQSNPSNPGTKHLGSTHEIMCVMAFDLTRPIIDNPYGAAACAQVWDYFSIK
ncbi:hypothetical protein, partial [Gluconobacter kondonii]|uniref:hypothetical protein n=2 Tax=Gluconobacter kondonii TaxID=941463 RepID=UPI001B8BB499